VTAVVRDLLHAENNGNLGLQMLWIDRGPSIVLRWRYKGGASSDLVEQLLNMPLDTVPDLFDADTHNELDRAVEKDVEDDLGDVSELSSDLQYRILLNAIVAGGKNMDRKYLDNKEAKNLIKTKEELRAMLASAWRSKSYREIRNLGASQFLRVVPITYLLTRGCCSIR